MSVLDAIAQRKREEVRRRSARLPAAVLRELLEEAPPPRDFVGALSAGAGAKVIAEIKRASPSEGVFRPKAPWDPVSIARGYQAGGARCLSVLTDGPGFWGSDDHLMAAREATQLPVLRKDFVVSEYQVDESRWLGADCVLLMASVLSPAELRSCAQRAWTLGMAVLFEAHTEAQLNTVLALDPQPARSLVGINHRDLTTLQMDMTRVERLAPRVPAGQRVVAESGLSRPEHLSRLMSQGVDTFLIGGGLCKTEDPGGALRDLLAGAA